MNVAADLVVDLAKEERESECHADVACDLEQPAVLPGEIDGQDGRLGRNDELGREVFPFGVNGALAPGLGCGGCAACRKYHKTATVLEVRLRGCARFDVGFE